MCGRRVAQWLTWTRCPACGWIPTGPCTSPRRGRVTLEHTPAGWPQWVVMTPAVPTSESGLHICLMSPLSYLDVCIFFPSLIYVGPQHDRWIFSPLLWFITALLSNPSNPLIFTMQGSWFGCLILLFAASLVWFYSSLSLVPSHMYTCTCRQLPHAPENPIAVLSTTEKRAINLTWAQAFDGNSPLIRYILEVSENSEWFITKAPVSPLTMHVSQKTDAFPFSHLKGSAHLQPFLLCTISVVSLKSHPLLPPAVSIPQLPHLYASLQMIRRTKLCWCPMLLSPFRLIKSKKWECFHP